MSRLKRYNPNKRGSFAIEVEFFDWELSSLIGALRAFRKDHESQGNKAYVSFLKRLERKLSKALGEVLKAEFRDLRLQGIKPLIEEKEALNLPDCVRRVYVVCDAETMEDCRRCPFFDEDRALCYTDLKSLREEIDYDEEETMKNG